MPNSVAVDEALRAAIDADDVGALRRAINAGDDIDLERIRANDPDIDLDPPLLLHAVVKARSTALFQFLIDAGADANSHLDFQGMVITPLTIAVRRQLPGAVAVLIAGGADVNQADQAVGGHSKWSPVYIAIYNGHRGILLNLLRAGGLLTRDLLEQIHTDIPDFAPDPPALLLVERFIRTADWAGFVRHHRGVLVSILAKCFGDALPREVLAEIATHWAPPGGS